MSVSKKGGSRTGRGSVKEDEVKDKAGAEALVEKCGECKRIVSNEDDGLQCEICQEWFHCVCQGMPVEAYQFINDNSVSLHWYCRRCNKEVSSMIAMMTKLQQRQDKLEQRQDKLETSIENLRGRHEKLENSTGEMIKGFKGMQEEFTLVKQATSSIEVKLDTMIEAKLISVKQEFCMAETKLVSEVANMKKDVSENLEIDKRKHNIVIHGLKESSGGDEDIVRQVLGDGLKMDPMRHVEEIHRIGSQADNKVRPIRVKIKSMEARMEILGRAKTLKDAEEFKKVYISPDLTREQQLQDKELRDRLKDYRQKGETGIKIKGGKLIKVGENGEKTIVFEIPKK